MSYTNQQLLQALKTNAELSKLANNAWANAEVISDKAELYQPITAIEQMPPDVELLADSADSADSEIRSKIESLADNHLAEQGSAADFSAESLSYLRDRLRRIIASANQLINSNFQDVPENTPSFLLSSGLPSEEESTKCKQLLLKGIRREMIAYAQLHAEQLSQLDHHAEPVRAVKNLTDRSKIYQFVSTNSPLLESEKDTASQQPACSQITLSQATEQLIALNQVSNLKPGYIALFDSYLTEAPTLPLLIKLLESEQHTCYPVPVSHPLLVYILRKEYISALAGATEADESQTTPRMGNFMLWLDAKAYWLTYAQAWLTEVEQKDLFQLTDSNDQTTLVAKFKNIKLRFHRWLEQQLVTQFLTHLGVSEDQSLTWFAETAPLSEQSKIGNKERIKPEQALTLVASQRESQLSFAQLQQAIAGLVANEQIGVYLTPGNLVTLNGYRIGYGGGYYDFEFAWREKQLTSASLGGESIADSVSKTAKIQRFYSVFWGYDYCFQELEGRVFQQHDKAVDKIFLLPSLLSEFNKV